MSSGLPNLGLRNTIGLIGLGCVGVLAARMSLAQGKSALAADNNGSSTKSQDQDARAQSAPGSNPAERTADKLPARLPKGVIPSHYELRIEPDLEALTFRGSVSITFDAKRPVNIIILHAANLDIHSAVIAEATNGRVSAGASPNSTSQRPITGRVYLDPRSDQLKIVLPEHLPVGRYHLNMDFSGKINTNLCGFFRSRYKDAAGVEQVIAATCMAPNYARQMFPCFDEPEFKSTYQITAVVDACHKVISVSPISAETLDPGNKKKIVVFQTTPPLPSYLVALVVGDLAFYDGPTTNGIPIKVWTLPGKEALGRYAADTAGKFLPFYENYFGISYPFKKLDLIALPEFAYDGMESPGAIMFPETQVLLRESQSSVRQKLDTNCLIAHEIAHMWFGDYATMHWWDDLWLNEAFADFMALKACNHILEGADMWNRRYQRRANALYTDSLKSTHAVFNPVAADSQAGEMFDELTYVKGACLLKMLEHYVGDANFQVAIRNYLRDHAFANAESKDLWGALSKVAHMPIEKIMDAWIKRPGYPALYVRSRATGGLVGGDTIVVEQQRFFIDGMPPNKYQINRADWLIPATFSCTSKSAKAGTVIVNHTHLLGKRVDSIPFRKQEHLLCANFGAFGYYRVRYGKDLLKSVLSKIDLLSPIERASFIDDQWNFLLCGDISWSEYLSILRPLRQDKSPTVMLQIIDQMNALSSMFEPRQQKPCVQLINAQLRAAAGNYDWKKINDQARKAEAQSDEKPDHKLDQSLDMSSFARASLVEALGTIGEDKEAAEFALEQFKHLRNHASNIDPSLRSAVINIVACHGEAKQYNQIKQEWLTYQQSGQSAELQMPEFAQDYLFALARFRTADLVQQTIDLAMSGQVKTQERKELFMLILKNPYWRRAGWQFIKDNWQAVVEKVPEPLMIGLVNALSSFAADRDARDIDAFFRTNPMPHCAQAIARSVERIQIRAHLSRKLHL